MVVESQLQETGDDREDRRINKTHLAVHCLFLLFLHDVGIISANQYAAKGLHEIFNVPIYAFEMYLADTFSSYDLGIRGLLCDYE